MPPKGATGKGKRKHAPTPEPEELPTPKKIATKSSAPRKPSTNPKKQTNGSPRKPNNITYTALGHSQGVIAPVNVSFEGNAPEAKFVGEGQYSHLLKLEASRTFSLLESIVISDGPHKDRQAIVIVPAKPFPLMELPEEVRRRIFQIYFAQNGLLNDPIVFDGKRTDSKEIFAKTYASGQKFRVGLLAVNKQIHKEALPVLFAAGFRFEYSLGVVDFFSKISSEHRALIRTVEIKNYNKAYSRNALNMLAEAKNIQSLRVDQGVCICDPDASKAAKSFLQDAHKFLEMVGSQRGDKFSALDVFVFGPLAFTTKGSKETKSVAWSEEDVEDFKEEVRKQLHYYNIPQQWTCLCGSLVRGHSCAAVFAARHHSQHSHLPVEEDDDGGAQEDEETTSQEEKEQETEVDKSSDPWASLFAGTKALDPRVRTRVSRRLKVLKAVVVAT